MDNPGIKICGIRTAEMAQAVVKAGADFIGVVCHPGSKRFVDVATARDITAATYAAKGLPVAVFVNHSAEQMLRFCQDTGIKIVQLNGDLSREEQHLLPEEYQRIYVCPVDETGPKTAVLQGLSACDIQRDYLLFDHANSGSGRTFVWHTLEYRGPFRIGIAGGLSKDNVNAAVQTFHPCFVDVSSRVENPSGEKDIHLIREFITAARPNKKMGV